MTEYNNVISAVKPITLLLDNNSLEVSQSTITSIGQALLGASDANKIAAINTLALTKAQKAQVITALNLDGAAKKVAGSTTLFGAAQAKVTNIVGGLKTALTALGTAIATHPIIAIGTVLATAVAGVALYQKKMMDDALESANTGAQAYNELSTSVDDYAKRYKELHDELTDANTTEERQHEIKKDLLSLQKELNEKYGDEYGKLNLVTQAYKDQTSEILKYKKAAANNFLTDNKKGIEKATKEMTKERSFVGIGSTGNIENDYAKRIYSIASKYESQGLKLDEFDDGSGSKGYTINLHANTEDADKVLHEFAAEIRELGSEFKDNNFINGILSNIEYHLEDNNKVIEKYQGIYNEALMAQIATDPTGVLSEGFNKATEAVTAYNNALVAGTDEDIQKTYKDLNDVKNSIDLTTEAWKPFRYIMADVFSQADTGLLDFQNALEKNTGNVQAFAKIVSGKTREELKAMADDGSVDYFDRLVKSGENYGLTIDQVIDVLADMGYVLDEVSTKGEEAFKPWTKEEVITNINSFSEGFESLDKIMNSIKDKKNPFDYALLDDKKFKDSFSELGDAYTDFVEQISNSPKDINATQSAFNNLVTEWIDGSGILNNLTDETAGLATAMLENMGILNAEEFVNSRLIASQEQLAAQKAYTAEVSEELANATAEEIPTIVDEAVQSDIAKVALAGLALQKEFFNKNPLRTDDDIENIIALVGVVGSACTALQALNTLKNSGNLGGNIGGKEGYEAILRAAQKEADDAIKAAANYKGKGASVGASYGGGTKTNKAGSDKQKKEKEPKTKDFEWIKRRQELLQKLHDKEQEIADDESMSYQTRIALIDDLIAKDNERLEFNKRAVDSYQDVWNEAIKKIYEEAGKQGLNGSDIVNSIMNGSDKDATYTGDMADIVDKAVDAYDNLTDAEEYSDELNQDITEHAKRQLELKHDIAKAQTDILKAESDSLSAEIQLMEATGKAISENQLRQQIALSEQITDSYYDQISALEDRLSEEKEGSAQYYAILAEISQCEAAIADCAVQQAEWNDQIKRLPIERINKFLEMLGYIKEDLQNFIDEQNALGKVTSLPQFQELANINLKQLEKYVEQQKLLSELLNDYEYGSEKYQSTVSDLQDIDNEISNLIQEQYEWNKAILQLPIDQLEKTNGILNNVVSVLGEILADYDSAISAVTGTLDKQIEAINDLKDATSKEYEARIKPYQDELDLLQKQNKERQIQLDLEQAKYDFDRAKEQKTNTVIRNGEISYEADQDAIRSAQNAYNDAEYNKVVHDLETQISNLEEERDKLLEGYDLQIEKLDEIKDRWNSIVDDIKLAADSLKADEIFGAGWQDKILTGNDADMLNSLKDLYTTISNQKSQYEEQIASNERIADMMNQFMEFWQNGSITYDQAMAGIKDLAVQMKDGYSSLEHLDALMGLNGATDLGTLLSQMQSSANASVSQFQDYMQVVKENAAALDKYNSSWAEMQENIKSQIAALEKLAEEAAKMAKSINKHSSGSGGGGGGSKGPNTNDNTYVKDGPGHTEEKLADAIANGKEILEYHRGGPVGDKNAPDKFIGVISSKNLEPGEVYGKLLKNEWVLTEDQQRMIKSNFLNSIPRFEQPQASMKGFSQQMRGGLPNMTINMGDINLPNVKDPDGFAKAMARDFDSVMRQEFSKVFKR